METHCRGPSWHSKQHLSGYSENNHLWNPKTSTLDQLPFKMKAWQIKCVFERPVKPCIYFQPRCNAQTAQVILQDEMLCYWQIALTIKLWGCCLLGQCSIVTSRCLQICGTKQKRKDLHHHESDGGHQFVSNQDKLQQYLISLATATCLNGRFAKIIPSITCYRAAVTRGRPGPCWVAQFRSARPRGRPFLPSAWFHWPFSIKNISQHNIFATCF